MTARTFGFDLAAKVTNEDLVAMIEGIASGKYKKCSVCGSIRSIDWFHAKVTKGRHRGYCKSNTKTVATEIHRTIVKKASICKICVSSNMNLVRLRMWKQLKARVGKARLVTIRPTDLLVPQRCIYLGCVLDYRPRNLRPSRPINLATIDRIDSSKDYIVGNVQVISDLANRMKRNATIENLVSFARGVIAIHDTK